MRTMKSYRRSRNDYPKGVIGIYDNKGKTADRYTVVFEPFIGYENRQYFPVLCMSGNPFHPQGIGIHNEYPFRPTRMKGEVVIDWSELPEKCQQCVLQDLEIENAS